MEDLYGAVAPFYDEINREINYDAWANFLASQIGLANILVHDVLDLCCGTGSMTLALARRGFGMVGIDRSPDMLTIAQARAAREAPGTEILWLCQDAASFELYGTVQAAVCCLDSVNHITDPRCLREMFRLLRLYLEPGGVFIFDVNSRRKYTEVYADNTYTYDLTGGYTVWQNHYDEARRLCDFDITVFTEEEDGRYRRRDEWQRERYYPVRTLTRMLTDAGFTGTRLFADNFRQTEGTGDAYRVHFVTTAASSREMKGDGCVERG